MFKRLTLLSAFFALIVLHSAAQAQPVRKLENVTTPAASECLSPEHAGLYGGFKNRCDFAVQFTYCVIDPGPNDWSSTFACVPGRKTNALDSVQAKAASANHTKGGKGVQWFACAYKRETATGPGPDGIWGDVVYELGIGLRGRCALRQYADPTTAPPIVPPVQLQQPVTAASSQAELAIMLNERKQWSDRNPNHLENSKITFEESMQYALLFLGEDLRNLQTHRARLTKAAYDQERNKILANMDGFSKTCRAVSKTPASCVAKYPAAWRSLPPPVRRAPQAVQAATPPKPQVARAVPLSTANPDVAAIIRLMQSDSKYASLSAREGQRIRHMLDGCSVFFPTQYEKKASWHARNGLPHSRELWQKVTGAQVAEVLNWNEVSARQYAERYGDPRIFESAPSDFDSLEEGCFFWYRFH